MKKYLISYAYLLCTIIILTLLLSIINYFIKVPSNIIKIIIPIVSMLYSSIILGKNSTKKAYIEGIKFSIIYIIFIFLFSILIKNKIQINIILYYLILILTSMFGSVIGINLKKK